MIQKLQQTVSLRVASLNDIAAIYALVNSAYRGDDSKKGWTTEADLLDGLRTTEAALYEIIQTPGSQILMAEKEGALQGCVYVEQQNDAFYLGMLSVRPELQGSGLGAMMMEAAEQKAKEAGCTKMKITVITERKELIAYYQRKRYADTGGRHPFVQGMHVGLPKRPLEFMEMEKKL